MQIDTNFYGTYIKYIAEDVAYRVFLKKGNVTVEAEDLNEAIKKLQN